MEAVDNCVTRTEQIISNASRIIITTPEWICSEKQLKKDILQTTSHELRAAEASCQNTSAQADILRRNFNENNCADECAKNNSRCGYVFRRKSPILLSRHSHIHRIGNLKLKNSLSTVLEEMPPTQGDEISHRRSISQLAKHLRCHCDKILDSSIPFVIDSCLLVTVSDAIDTVMSNDPNMGKENAEEIKYQDYVMFLSDFFEQTPSLCLTLGTGTGTAPIVEVPPSIDMQYFRNLQFLELRKVPPNLLGGLNSVKASLKRLKCTRCLESLSQVLNPVSTFHLPEDIDSEAGQPMVSANISCVWPELIEIDFSFNRISDITTASDSLEVTPVVEILNLSRNMISAIDDSFTKVLNCLSVLNLNYNKLTIIPPLPPNLKVLLLAHNYITNMTAPSMSFSISSLKRLEMLDLSTNMISDENDLSILRHLSCLTSVAFMGNPLSYLETYRTTVCSNLNRLVLKKSFTLDKKKLSNSEIRSALESMKNPKFVPFIPSETLGLGESSMTSSFTTGTCSASNRFNRLKSLTQSYDSNTSSLRSSCRKKPKIREIVLDHDDDEVSPVSKTKNEDFEVILAPGSKVQKSYSSGSSSPSEKSEIIVLETKATIASIRETYGEEFWLLKQAGDKVKKLLKIPNHPANSSAEMFYSKSLPKANTSSYLEYSNDVSNKTYQDRLTDAELFIFSSGRANKTLNSNKNNPDSTNQSDLLVTAKHSFDATSGAERSAEFSESSIFYSCNSRELTSSEKLEDEVNISAGKVEEMEEASIFDFETDADTPEIFSDKDGHAEQFRIFQSGNCFSLAVLYNYLYEIQPDDSIVVRKWDLKSLKSLLEENCDSETETVEFSLHFDTVKKQLREKTFIMSAKDFYRFDKLVSPYIEERALQEFADAMQCIKCNTQFSRAMANTIVKQERGQPPKEITVCPNPDCQSEFLVPLDELPLPNNGVLSVEGADFLFNGPLRSSTPVSGHVSMSIPKHSGQSARHMEAKAHASSLTTKVTHSKSSNYNHSNSDSIENVPRPATASSSEKSSITVLNTRSDSDIEVLSCDSSSIEVLAKNSADSSSDIEVQEAVEVEVVEGASKSAKSLVMTESTSSGSYADSICTTYEKKLMANMQPLSQPLSPRTASLASQSTSTSFSSLTSTSTLTTYGCSSPSRTTAVPIRYDYNDFKVDHRLQLFCELVVFKKKSVEEKLIMLTKVLAISDATAPFLSIVIISNIKIYFYKIVGVEGDKPQDWLQKVSYFDVSKLLKLDVLIGRHGVGLDLSGKYYALLFRDSQRTLNFVKFFMGISDCIDLCPMIRDFSQTQKALMSPNSVSYFGILRFAVCDNDKSYAVSAIVLTDEELMLLGDLGWIVARTGGNATAKHIRHLSSLRQVESLESDPTFIRLIIEAETYLLWEFLFETEEEKDIFVEMLKAQTKNVPFISLSQPIEP